MINPDNVAGRYADMQDNLFSPYGTNPNATSEYSLKNFGGTINGFNSTDSGLGYRFDVSKIVNTSTEIRPYNIALLPLITY